MTLGQIIATLKDMPADAHVVLDSGREQPESWGFHSWRGVYAHLALDYERYDSARPASVGVILEAAEDALDREFEGYKGGQFYMDADTPVWLAHYGSSEQRAIIAITHAATGGPVVMRTADIGEYLF
jgi:hypothetical protein